MMTMLMLTVGQTEILTCCWVMTLHCFEKSLAHVMLSLKISWHHSNFIVFQIDEATGRKSGLVNSGDLIMA